MRSLSELLSSKEGMAFLGERGVFVDAALFVEQLETPASRSLTDLLGLQPDCRLVYVGQQACTDYERPTTWKFEVARDLGNCDGVVCVVLWHDMYQADADRFGARLLLPGGKRTRGIWLVPRSVSTQEPRFLPVERACLEDALAQMAAWLEHAPCADQSRARARLALLEKAVLSADITTLGQANGALGSCLLREELGFDAPSTFASEMVARGLLTNTLNEYLANIDEVVTVFNAAVENLIALDIDPQVRPIPAEYLPLHYSCSKDGTRMRLAHERSGTDHFAAATCSRCDTRYRFHLGNGSLSLGELEATERWSLDVSMPVFHNDIASGWVAGRSTALYGLVFNEVLKKVLGRRPIPALVPPQFTAPHTEAEAAMESTLLIDYLTRPASRSPETPA